jgi:hypothetical protein
MSEDTIKKPTQEMIELFKRTGDQDQEVAFAAQKEFATALKTPLRDGIMSGNNFAGIFSEDPQEAGVPVEYPLSFLAPGTEKDFAAFTISIAGRIPERSISGDYVMVPMYKIANAIDWNLDYARKARWNIASRALQVMRDGFIEKLNNDAWHVIISAAADRNILVWDGDAPQGMFTKRLVSLSKVIMQRNGGGNATSLNKGTLTDVYLSPEGLEDIRNWNVDQVDDTTRREIFLAPDDGLTQIYQVRLHQLTELGVSQPYQNYLTDTLSGSLQASDVELAIGLDLAKDDSFMMPIDEEMQVFPDPVLHRSIKEGYYGWMGVGFVALDTRRVLAMSF